MSDGMKKIQPLDSLGKEEFFRPASRLIEAQYKQYRSYHERPIQRDMFAEYDAIAAWSTVTCCYSGIEQAMKCLLQMRDAYIDQSLCQACFKRVQGKGSEECKKVNKCGYKEHYEELFQAHRDFVHSLDDRRHHKHHYIGKLFRALACEEQDVLRASYAIYRSLHDYLPPETADCFLDAIDSGYPTWRYFLLEGEMPPTTHPGAMLEVWSALTDILKARVFTNHGLNTVKQRIDFRLRELHIEAAKGECNDLVQINSLIPWRRRDTFININQYIDLLYYDANGQPLQIKQPTLALPPVLSMPRVLHRFVDKVKEDITDNDFMHFRCRAQKGKLVWNAVENCFEAF